MIPCDPDTYNQIPPEIRRALEEGAKQRLKALSKPTAKSFTWDDARGVAMIVRDGLLMIVRGLEKIFDIGKK